MWKKRAWVYCTDPVILVQYKYHALKKLKLVAIYCCEILIIKSVCLSNKQYLQIASFNLPGVNTRGDSNLLVWQFRKSYLLSTYQPYRLIEWLNNTGHVISMPIAGHTFDFNFIMSSVIEFTVGLKPCKIHLVAQNYCRCSIHRLTVSGEQPMKFKDINQL